MQVQYIARHTMARSVLLPSTILSDDIALPRGLLLANEIMPWMSSIYILTRNNAARVDVHYMCRENLLALRYSVSG